MESKTRFRAWPYLLIVILATATAAAAWTSVAAAPRLTVASRMASSPTAPRPWRGDIPQVSRSISGPNEELATHEARRLMALLPTPTSWRAVASAPTPALTAPDSWPASSNLVDLYQLWRANATLAVVESWISAHPPVRARPVGTGSAFQGGALLETSRSFGFPAVADELESRQLLVAAAPLPGGGVGVRVDAQVIWYPSRPVSEVIPTAVTRVAATVFTQDALSGSTKDDLATRTFTSRSVVRLLAQMVDSSPLAVPGARSCPADTGSGPQLDLDFSGRAGVPRVVVHVDTNGCGGTSFTISGVTQPPLTDNGLFSRVDQLLGIDPQL